MGICRVKNLIAIPATPFKVCVSTVEYLPYIILQLFKAICFCCDILLWGVVLLFVCMMYNLTQIYLSIYLCIYLRAN
jgi:hypothetical protein